MVRPTKNTTNELRTSAFADYYNFEIHLFPKLCSPFTMFDTPIMGLKQAILVPDLSMYYFNKIGSTSDKRIYDVLYKLLYLNNGCNNFVKKRLAEHVLRHFVTHHKVESEVGLGKMKMVPIISHKQIMRVINYLLTNYDVSKYTPDKQVYHMLFSRNKLTKEQKMRVALSVRWSIHKQFVGMMIDNAVDMLIEYDDFTKITTGRIYTKKIVINEKGSPVAYNTINSNLTDYAAKRIENTQTHRLFTDEEISHKLSQYLTTGAKSLNELVTEYQISKSTAIKFQKIKDGQIFNSDNQIN